MHVLKCSSLPEEVRRRDQTAWSAGTRTNGRTLRSPGPEGVVNHKKVERVYRELGVLRQNDPLGMRGVQRVGDFDGKREQRFNFEWTPSNAMFQRHAIEKFHGNEGVTVLLAHIVNGADVRVVQCGGRLCFALKSSEGLRISGHILGQEFQCDKPVEARVLSFVDNAHAAAPEFIDDAVVRDGMADH